MTRPVEWIDWVSQQSWAFKDLMGQPVEHSPTRRPRSVTSSTSVNPLDEVILIDCSSGAVTLTLETAVGADGRTHLFKKTDSSTNALIIDGRNSETIDGKATFTIRSQDVAVTIQSDGSNWKTVGDNYSGLMAVPTIVSVSEHRFGVTGDGSTNDATALQAVIDAAGDGGVVIWPKPVGHYFIGTTSLKIRQRQTWIGGSRTDSGAANDQSTTIRYTGSGSAVYGIGLDSNTFTENVRISGLRIIGHSSAQVLNMSGFIQSVIEFLNIDTSNSSGIGVLLGSTAGTSSGGGNCYYNTLWHVTLLNSPGIGIKILESGDSGTNDNRILGGKNTSTVGIKFEGTGTGNSGNVVAFCSFENGAAASGRAINCDAGSDNIFIHNRYEYVGASALDFLFGTNSATNVIVGGHFGSDVSGMRITDNGTNNSWYACTDTSTVEVKANEFIGDLTGTATNATNAVVANEASDTTCFPTFVTAATGNLGIKTNANMSFNSNTGVMTLASSVLTTTDINGGTVDGAAIGGSSPSTGAFTTISASGQITSTVSTGSPPLVVASTTKVSNLNADLLDDQTGSYYLDSANFTGTNWTDLTDGGDTTLHQHSAVTVANEATDTTCFLNFTTAASGNLQPKTNTNMTFNSSTGVATFASTVLTTTDINGGTVDGAVIGAGTSAAGTFTDLTSTGNTTLGNEEGDSITINAGSVTRPNSPAFLAYNSASDSDQTGNGGTATVDFDTEVFDRGSDFSADTFTAPYTGIYHFDAHVLIFDTTTAMSGFDINLVTSNRTHSQSSSVNVESAGDFVMLNISTYADMDAADTASVTVRVSGGAGNTADILGSAQLYTSFSGRMVA